MDKKFENPQGIEYRKSSTKTLLIFYFKRFFHYFMNLHGIITIIFLIIYFQGVIDQRIIIFYLYFSIVFFVAYGFMILGIHWLQKSETKIIPPDQTQVIEPSIEFEEKIDEDFFQGKTLQVYWYFYLHSHAGVREIQKALKISSSGTVSYQISKLLKAGIISRDDEEGKYLLKEDIKVGILKFFARIGHRAIPRISLYLIIYIIGFVIYLILAVIHRRDFFLDPINLLLLFFLILGTIIFVFESYKIWRLRPIK